MKEIREVILNVYLDLSREGSDLRDMAYAKAVLWTLFANDGLVDFESLKSDIASLVGQQGIPSNSLESALSLLLMKKLITKESDSYAISLPQREAMDRQIEYSHKVTDDILSKRFPKQIERATLKTWFAETNSEYFGAGADTLISLHSKRQKPIFNVETVLKPVIAKHKLQKFEKELIQGYREFLTSSQREEEEKVFNLLSSTLSSRLVAANLSPETLSIDKYRDSEMLLDTNILLGMGLYRDADLERAFNSLGSVADKLNIKFSVAEFTVDEYEIVRRREKDNFIALISSYSKKIFEGINEKNDFVRSMKRLGCENSDDVERFFEETLRIPEKVGKKAITVLKDKKLMGSYYIEDYDAELLRHIQKETGKSENTAIHDLRLNKLAQKFAEKNKTFVLTMDSRMEAFALNQVNEKEEPLWFSMYGFIQILAVNGGGPNFNPSDLAPLIKTFIEFEEATNEEKYDERDLLMLLEKTDRVNELPETQMVSLLNKLHRIRLKRSPEEGVREITLELDRALRQNSNKADNLIKEKQSEIDSLSTTNKGISGLLAKAQKDLKSEKIKNIYVWFFIRSAFYLSISAFLFLYLAEELIEDYSGGRKSELISNLATVISVLGLSVTDYFSYTSRKLDKISNGDGEDY